MNKITVSQLEQYLSKAAWILKGPVDASDVKVYIFRLFFFKRVSDVYDEEFRVALEESNGDAEYAALPEFHRFSIPAGCHWNNVRETTENVGQSIEVALRGIEQANQDFLYGIFGDAQWSNKNKLSDKLLIDLIEHFSQYQLGNDNVNPDMLGQAYEYLIKHFADLTNKKAGEFYTPRSVVHLLGLILDPHEGESIYDPACGTGGMLLECVDHLKHNKEDSRTLKFYGTQLAACVMVFKKKKEPSHQGKVLFIDASTEIRVGRAQNFLEPEHVQKIYTWFTGYGDVENHVKAALIAEIAENDYNLNIPLYVEKIIEDTLPTVEEAMSDLKSAWKESLVAEEKFKTILSRFVVS